MVGLTQVRTGDLVSAQKRCEWPEIWRRGRESNPRMMVLQTIPLDHLGTAPLSLHYAQNLCPKLCPMHPIFAYCPLIQSLQPIDTSWHRVKREDLQTSPLGHLGTAPNL